MQHRVALAPFGHGDAQQVVEGRIRLGEEVRIHAPAVQRAGRAVNRR